MCKESRRAGIEGGVREEGQEYKCIHTAETIHRKENVSETKRVLTQETERESENMKQVNEI